MRRCCYPSHAIDIRDNFSGQTRRIEDANDRFSESLEQIPGIGNLVRLINRASLKNQIVLHAVFYFCLYHLITAIFG